MEKIKKIIVTGGCGFIGSSFIKSILENSEARVRIIDNFSVGSPKHFSKIVGQLADQSGALNWANRLEIVESDVTSLDTLCQITKGASHFVHLAANTGVAPSIDNPIFDCFSNVVGTVNCLECCRLNGIEKFVFASSGAPLGEQDPPINEYCVPKPVSPYGASKLSGEGYCSAYNGSFGIDTVALRFGNVYGPGSVLKQSAVAKFIKLAFSGEEIEIYGDGQQTRDFIYIDDLCDAINKALDTPNIGGEVFQIATASETTVNELVTGLEKSFIELGISFPKIKYSEARKGDVRRNFSDTTKAKKLLGWQSQIRLSYGLKETIRYFRSGARDE